MSASLLYAVNQSVQDVPAGGVVSPGSVIRRFGANLNLSGNGVEIRGPGYYEFSASVVCAPDAAGTVTATLLKDGSPIPGAVASATVADASSVVTLPVLAAVRLTCCGDSASAITCALSDAASVSSFAVLARKA